MRTALITAIALVAIAIPAGTTASAAVKPIVVNVTAVNGRPVGGINRPTVKKGQTVRIVFAAADLGSPSTIEAAVDDVRIIRPLGVAALASSCGRTSVATSTSTDTTSGSPSRRVSRP